MMAAAPPTPLVDGSLPSNMAGFKNAENSGTSCVWPVASVNGMVSLIIEWPTRYMAPANSSEVPGLTSGLQREKACDGQGMGPEIAYENSVNTVRWYSAVWMIFAAWKTCSSLHSGCSA